ncbi:T-cell surface glycoprotein CD3 epsilon chain-like [Gouania willdenowi]|uniref:CD3 gamma/delta subunit Ig-like domain-containing protein n=1 Tax=Gouania willdenowi TaxID=441366 RepID=A0A8C5D832_GOUWI|nr:T-cell surface glycoprotein CD3 epsilon chain [Gouania willdenowi]
MYRFTVQPVFIVLILFPAAVKTAQGNVEFWREDVTLTCPNEGQWFLNDVKVDNDDKDKLTFKYTGRVHYRCEFADSEKYNFYVEGKTCENCFELDTHLLLAILVVNLTMTIGVMIIVYKCTKKKMSAVSTKAPARSGAPPTPSRDYEELMPHTRAKDTYSVVNRTG